MTLRFPTDFAGCSIGVPLRVFLAGSCVLYWPHRREIRPKTWSQKLGFMVCDPGVMGFVYVVALWEAFRIEKKCFDLDTPRVPNRSPTPISKSNDFRGQSDDIWVARVPHFQPMLGVSGVGPARNTYFLAL